MKRKFLIFPFASICLLSFGVVGLTSCDSASSFKVATVKLAKSETHITVGTSEQLVVSVSKGYGGEIRWFSSNENVAVVNSGYVFGVGEGTAVITAAYYGGYASCTVTVGPGEDSTTDRLVLTPSEKTIGVADTFSLTYKVVPADATVTFVSSDSNIASVTAGGLVTGVGLGATVITATGSNGKVATCNVTVRESGGGGGEDLDIGVGTNLNYEGTFKIGAPPGQETFTQQLLNSFNTKTGSTVTFNVVTFAEDKAADNMSDPSTGPDVYPYASDQTLRLYARQIIYSIGNSDADWIAENMGEKALDYATLAGVNRVAGYPFAADNGYVMFYDKSLVTASEIDTVDKLFAKAESMGYEVDYDLTSGFYAAGAIMSYTGGKSLYSIKAKDNGSYTAEGNFSSEEGLQGAKLMYSIFKKPALMGAAEAPGSLNKVLATITDCSKVETFKGAMKENYACAPLPYIDGTTTRLGVYLGYKFFGINSYGRTEEHNKISNDIAKFLVSEYAQSLRFEKFYTKPTMTSLQDLAENEQHVAALNAQIASNGVIPLTAVDSALWSETMAAAKEIKGLTGEPSDSEYYSILDSLDVSVSKN